MMNPSPVSVLLIEDDVAIAKALELKLLKAGYQVIVAHDGEEGLAAYKTQGFAVILLDIMMPRVDGWTVLEELQRLNNTIPILVTTNLNQAEDLAKATSLGATATVTKSNESLSEIISEITALITKTATT